MKNLIQQSVEDNIQCKKQVCFAMGGHVIKTGMSPIIIDLMKKNVFTMISMNGSGIIHNLETAMMGRTNVVNRPTLGKGRGFSIVGHHEILIPLIAAGVIESL